MTPDIEPNSSAIGCDIVTVNTVPNVVFRNYTVDRPAHTPALKSVESVLEVTVTVPHPVSKVWPIFVDFNKWMNRFGYIWQGVPGENEDRFVLIANSGASNNIKYGSQGQQNKYVVRKVIKEQLMYFDSLPYKLLDKDAVFTGHNLMSMREFNGQTAISIFMEHTWHSETVTLEELRVEARRVMFDDALAFWRDYFIPDLIAAIEAG
jgi:hypothetical protein